jgi:hypothetical protein
MLSHDSREDTLMARIDRLEQLLMSVVANGAQYPNQALRTLYNQLLSPIVGRITLEAKTKLMEAPS